MRSQLKDYGFKTQSELLILSRYSCLSLGAEPPGQSIIGLCFLRYCVIFPLYCPEEMTRGKPWRRHWINSNSPNSFLESCEWKQNSSRPITNEFTTQPQTEPRCMEMAKSLGWNPVHWLWFLWVWLRLGAVEVSQGTKLIMMRGSCGKQGTHCATGLLMTDFGPHLIPHDWGERSNTDWIELKTTESS